MPFKEKLSLKFLMVIFKIFKLASFSSRLSPRARIFKRISITATLVPIAHEVTILIFSFVKPYQVTQFNHWLLLLFKIDCQGRNAIRKFRTAFLRWHYKEYLGKENLCVWKLKWSHSRTSMNTQARIFTNIFPILRVCECRITSSFTWTTRLKI